MDSIRITEVVMECSENYRRRVMYIQAVLRKVKYMTQNGDLGDKH